MRRMAIAILLGVLLSCSSAWAQGAPKAIISGGYVALWKGEGVPVHGFFADVEGIVSDRIGFAADFGMGSKRFEELGVVVDTKTYTFLFGPRFSSGNRERARILGDVLIGGTRYSAGAQVGGEPPLKRSATAFTFAMGFGVDVNLSKTFAIRPIFWNFVLGRLTVNGEPDYLFDMRFGAGIALTLGK